MLVVRLSSRNIKYYKNIILIISLSLEELYNLLQIEEQASDITVKTDKGIGVGSKLFFFIRRVGAAKTDPHVNSVVYLGFR